MGIEPTYPAWEAGVLPMNYIRIAGMSIAYPAGDCKSIFQGRHKSFFRINGTQLSMAPRPPNRTSGGSFPNSLSQET